ncbi:MAG: hypothetical protein WBS20_01785 [Lysobacterales bacterium]
MSISGFFHRIVLVTLAAASAAGCYGSPGPLTDPWPEAVKIKFRLDDIRPDGLRGPPDGLVAVTYEFCVPDNERVYREIRQIDSGLHIHHGARGRIGCAANQSLTVGETARPRWHDVLQALSSLAYVTEIRECFFE